MMMCMIFLLLCVLFNKHVCVYITGSAAGFFVSRRRRRVCFLSVNLTYVNKSFFAFLSSARKKAKNKKTIGERAEKNKG